MAKDEKFVCPDVDCGHVDYSEGECPVCGCELVKPKGEEYRFDPKMEDDEPAPHGMMSDDLDDPSDITWYAESGEGYGTM